MDEPTGRVNSDGWIVVPNWERFQHYKDRTPPWIKLYLELLHKPEFLDLTFAARGVLMTVWLLYTASDGVLDVSQVRAQCTSKARARHFQGHLEALSDAGFIQFSASRPLAQRQRRGREERDIPQTPFTNGARDEGAVAAVVAAALNAKTGCTHSRCKGLEVCAYE